MSTKMTFDEMVERTAQKTDYSKSFLHDFMKDVLEVINKGIQTSGKVNIAKFGKFELQEVEEKEGYNPQLEKKMVIPAHQKVIFKPYKNIRKIVNAPYTHMKPQRIDSQNDPESSFIPTAPPADIKSSQNVPDSGGITTSKKHSDSQSSAGPINNIASWIAAGTAFLAASAGAWFFLRDDE